MRKQLLLLLFAVAPPLSASANGDPVIGFSSVTRSCNPIPRTIKDVAIVKEKLVFRLGIPYTTVIVDYTLKNNSSKEIKDIDYGFPVDYVGTPKEKSGFVGDDWGESIYECGWWDGNVKDVQFFLNDSLLQWHSAHQAVTPWHQKYDEAMEDSVSVWAESRLWTYTKFSVPANAVVNLRVKYSVYNSNYTPAYPYSFIQRYTTSNGSIKYDFQPAKHWGNGKTAQLEVVVDGTALPPDICWRTERYFTDDADIDKSPSISWEGFKREGKTWYYTSKDFDFSTAKELKISFDKREGYGVSPVKETWIPVEKFRISETNYGVVAMKDTVDIYFPKPMTVTDISFMDKQRRLKKIPSWVSNNPKNFVVSVIVTFADGFVQEYEAERRGVEPQTFQLIEHSYDVDYNEHPYYINICNIHLLMHGRYVSEKDQNGEKTGSYVIDEKADNRVKNIRLIAIPKERFIPYTSNPISEIKVYDFSQRP